VKKRIAILATGTLVAGIVAAVPSIGTAASTGQTPAAMASTPAASPITWGKCPTGQYQDLKGTKVRCAALKVPLSYANPTGPTITLEVSILKHTSSAKNYKGVMLSNPGGPGGPGLDLGFFLQPAVPNHVGDDYDWISWDPRGVGASKPAIHCQNNYFNAPRRSYDPTTKSLLNYWLARSKKYADECEAKYPALLKNMTTVDSVNDMESIRKAVGVSQISYYGFSYGTYLGQVYSTLFPTHLKYMVLDSNVDPRRVWYGANLDQDKAFNRNIGIYFAWVAKHHKVFKLGASRKTVENRYYATLAKLTKHPKGKLGPDEWADAFESAAYYRFGWNDLANAWVSYALHGHTAKMVAQYVSSDGPGDDNEFAVYNAVQCTDVQWPTKWSKWASDNKKYNKKYPFLTWGNAWFNAPCLYWGAPATTPTTINGKATKSALLIDETLDAATPYPGSLEVRKLYPNSSLLAEPGGTTHADSLFGDKCVDDIIAKYLDTGKRPARKPGNGPDTTCKPLPPPAATIEGGKTISNLRFAPARPF
jgi:pimeloyl-ACP methyl ester carboxylesterase